MAGSPFTSVGTGNWNDGATWGNDTPGVKGTDWPGTAGDVVNIGTTAGNAHVVTYNVSEANELGTITIGATSGAGTSQLIFATDTNTLLTLAATKYVVVNAKGKYTQGASGAVIGAAYTSELRAAAGADSTCGIKLNGAGGIIEVYGDPAYYGSDDHAFLAADWATTTDNNTFLVTGDYTTKWATGALLYVHKGAAAYAAYVADINNAGSNDTTAFTIASMSYAAPNTTININEVVAGGITFRQGARVVNAGRNVIWSKSSANVNLGQQNTNRMHITTNNISSGTFNLNDMLISGSTGINAVLIPNTGTNIHTVSNVVIRNGSSAINGSHYGTYSNLTVISSANVTASSATLNNITGTVFGCSGTLIGSDNNTITAGNFYSNQSNMFGSTGAANNVSGVNWFGNGSSIIQAYCPTKMLTNCRIGSDENGLAIANTNDFSFNGGGTIDLLYCNVPASPTWQSRNTAPFTGYFRFEHYDQTIDDHRIFGAYGTSQKVVCGSGAPVPNQRSGGSSDAIQLSALSNCSTALIFKQSVPRIAFTTGTQKTYRFYVQTDYTADALVTAGFKLYGTYIAQTTGLITAATPSTQNITTRDDADDWDQYVEITIPSTAQTGWIDLWFQLMQYENAKFVWIDPKMVVS